MVWSRPCLWRLVWVWGLFGLGMAWLWESLRGAGLGASVIWTIGAVLAVGLLVLTREI